MSLYSFTYVNEFTIREFASFSRSKSVLMKSKTPLSPKAPHSISMITWSNEN